MEHCKVCNKPCKRSTTHSNGEMSFTHETEPRNADFMVGGHQVTYTELSFCHTSNEYLCSIKGLK